MAQYPQFQVPLDLYLEAPVTPAALGALVGPFRQVREAINTNLEAMLVGAKDPEQALSEAAAEATDAIEEYNERVGD